MPVPDFDHNVQQQLKELKLPLSEPVWEKLEARLRQRRKRRILFLLVFMIFLLSGIGFLIQSQPFGTKSVSIIQNHHSYDSSAKYPEHSGPVISLSHTARQDSGRQDHLITENKIEDDHLLVLLPAANSRSLRDPKKVRSIQDQIPTQELKDRLPLAAYRNIEQSVNFEGNMEIKPSILNEGTSGSSTEKELYPFVSTSFTDLNNPNPRVVAEIKSVPLTVNKMASHRRNNPPRYQYGIQASAGVSALVSGGIFNIWEKTALADASPLNSGFNGNFVPPPASKVREGWSWHAGFWVRRNFTRKWSVETGLNYLEQSARINTGSVIDSLQFGSPSRVFTLQSTGLYRNGNTNIFTNRYRFIELPVLLKYTLNASSKMPVSFSGGIALNRLVQSKALHYDQSTGIYFSDEDLFRKTQWSIQTGIHITLAASRKRPLDIGARFRYAGTPLYLNNANNNKNLSGLSLEAKWYLR